MNAKTIMLQGTGSDVGKSLIVAGLCRAFVNRGLLVRPFKPQNMSNNAAVTGDGGEIGRAQAVQARACRTAPSVHMNPVLLKPQSRTGSQIVVQGKVAGQAEAKAYQQWKPRLMAPVLESFGILRAQADLVIVEGAGSASEINLRPNDIANMGFAQAAQIPVIVTGDIDRGGVIAQIAGTKHVLAPDDARLVAGFLVNKFRGDPTLFADGMALIEAKTGWRALGLIPYFDAAAKLPAEDSLALRSWTPGHGPLTITVPLLPGISNFDDLDPLRFEAAVRLVMVRPGEALPGDAQLVILPGSKTTIADLAVFKREGWDIDLAAHVRRGGHVLGLCGGYQMLGRRIDDPHGAEGPPGAAEGLGFLDIETRLTGEKRLAAVAGESLGDDMPFHGYEMHMGETWGPGCARPLLRFHDGRLDGAISANGRIAGCYVHGLFADDRQRTAFLARFGAISEQMSYDDGQDEVLDALAAHLERHVDLNRIFAIAR